MYERVEIAFEKESTSWPLEYDLILKAVDGPIVLGFITCSEKVKEGIRPSLTKLVSVNILPEKEHCLVDKNGDCRTGQLHCAPVQSI